MQDLPFPAVDPAWNEKTLDELADQLLDRIQELRPDAVLCQGESTLEYRVVSRLLGMRIPVFAACSQRQAEETLLPDGSTRKLVRFDFCRFRRYDSR